MQNARNLPRIASKIRYVGVDFEKDDLAEALTRAGFDSSSRAVFIWEGVTMYLPRAAIESTLSIVQHASASGSCLLTTYYDRAAEARTRFARPLFSIIGEPLRSSFSRDDIREIFSAHDFEIEADDGDDEWGERYVGSKPMLDMSERLVTARRK